MGVSSLSPHNEDPHVRSEGTPHPVPTPCLSPVAKEENFYVACFHIIEGTGYCMYAVLSSTAQLNQRPPMRCTYITFPVYYVTSVSASGRVACSPCAATHKLRSRI